MCRSLSPALRLASRRGRDTPARSTSAEGIDYRLAEKVLWLGSMLSTDQGCPAPSSIRFNGTAKVQLP